MSNSRSHETLLHIGRHSPHQEICYHRVLPAARNCCSGKYSLRPPFPMISVGFLTPVKKKKLAATSVEVVGISFSCIFFVFSLFLRTTFANSLTEALSYRALLDQDGSQRRGFSNVVQQVAPSQLQSLTTIEKYLSPSFPIGNL